MRRFLTLVAIIAIFLAGLYFWTQRRQETRRATAFTPAATSRIDPKDVELLTSIDREYTRVVEAVVPSVVSITTTKRVQTGYLIDPYEFFFNHRLRGVPQEQDRSSLGSGVIVSQEGHILTNNHVVAEMDKILVELSDGRMMPAEIIGTDPETDIAILKINPDHITALPIGNSDDVKVGQLVFAIGNPLGLQETVTRGIISAKSRVIDDTSLEYFQTDAAVNQGNSGGPLVNVRGEIIGINTRIASQTGGSQGLSFAIPSNVARRTLEAILKNGRVVRSYLGVEIRPVPPERAAQLNLKEPRCALVTQVLAGSPAEKAGLLGGDVITKFNGREITGVRDLHNSVAETAVGSKIQLDVIRANGEPATLTAEITAQPADFRSIQPVPQPTMPQAQSVPQGQQPPPSSPSQPLIPQQKPENLLAGIRVVPIPPGASASLPENVRGVMVASIDVDSPAALSPGTLRVGDVIEEIDRKPVTSVEDFEKTVQGMNPDARQVLLFICRGKTRSFAVITPP